MTAERLEYQPSPSQPRLLCHRSPCDLEFLRLSPVSSPSLSPQKQAFRATYSTAHPIPAPITLPCLSCCVLSPLSWCVFLPVTQPSTSLQSSQGGDTEGEGGVRRWVLVCVLPPASARSPSQASFSPVSLLFTLFFFFLTSSLQDLLWPWSASRALGHPRPPSRKRKGGMWADGRSPGDCARGPAKCYKATLWFSTFSPYLILCILLLLL